MRAEFAYAPNLTIVDTPGFILKVGLEGHPEHRLPGFPSDQSVHSPATNPLPLSPSPLDPASGPAQARKGEADSTPDDILAMVKAQCAPPHRLILFLQQSSVEWCSSLWMHIVQEVDPHFQRTGVWWGVAGRGAGVCGGALPGMGQR